MKAAGFTDFHELQTDGSYVEKTLGILTVIPKKYYWTDIESGETFECSKEYRETMLSIWESAKPKLMGNQKFGTVLFCGTSPGGCDTYDEHSKGSMMHKMIGYPEHWEVIPEFKKKP
tara:strand:- start:18698 stop:19048 length:351 start_codon:yes stop_codon:yes gene_type:complete